MKKRDIVFAFAFVLHLAFSVSASYISGDIFLSENGFARFDILTDIPLNISGLEYNNNKISGTTDILTSKNRGIWTFELNSANYNSTFLNIHLPKALDSIISIQGENYLFDLKSKTLTLLEPTNFKISYSLTNGTGYFWIIYPAIFILIVAIYFFYKKKKRKKEHLEHIMPLINENEQKIIDLLMKSPKRQKEIRKILNIPKASFTRYLINLEKKKLISREGEGKNKIVRLK